jgi:AraC family transcriptional regulator
MEYKQIHLPAIKLVGIGVETSPAKAPIDCPKVWEKFMSQCEKVKNQKKTMIHLGVSTQANAEACTMRYTAGSEVSEFIDIPNGMEKIELPESEYFLFLHKGKIDTLGNTYGDIMGTIEKSGKKQKDFWIEKYDSRWKADNDDSEFEILIPII